MFVYKLSRGKYPHDLYTIYTYTQVFAYQIHSKVTNKLHIRTKSINQIYTVLFEKKKYLQIFFSIYTMYMYMYIIHAYITAAYILIYSVFILYLSVIFP